MGEFLSVRGAYENWHQLRYLQAIVTAALITSIVLGLLWAALVTGTAWVILDRSRRRYRALFWVQALALHSSKREGEPEIYEFMTKRDRSEHAKRSLEIFTKKSKEE